MTPLGVAVLDSAVKRTLVLLALGSVCLSSCTTLQNRRDLYSPQTADGPYTRALKGGHWPGQLAPEERSVAEGPESSPTAKDGSRTQVAMKQ